MVILFLYMHPYQCCEQYCIFCRSEKDSADRGNLYGRNATVSTVRNRHFLSNKDAKHYQFYGIKWVMRNVFCHSIVSLTLLLPYIILEKIFWFCFHFTLFTDLQFCHPRVCTATTEPVIVFVCDLYSVLGRLSVR